MPNRKSPAAPCTCRRRARSSPPAPGSPTAVRDGSRWSASAHWPPAGHRRRRPAGGRCRTGNRRAQPCSPHPRRVRRGRRPGRPARRRRGIRGRAVEGIVSRSRYRQRVRQSAGRSFERDVTSVTTRVKTQTDRQQRRTPCRCPDQSGPPNASPSLDPAARRRPRSHRHRRQGIQPPQSSSVDSPNTASNSSARPATTNPPAAVPPRCGDFANHRIGEQHPESPSLHASDTTVVAASQGSLFGPPTTPQPTTRPPISAITRLRPWSTERLASDRQVFRPCFRRPRRSGFEAHPRRPRPAGRRSRP